MRVEYNEGGLEGSFRQDVFRLYFGVIGPCVRLIIELFGACGEVNEKANKSNTVGERF